MFVPISSPAIGEIDAVEGWFLGTSDIIIIKVDE